MTEPDESDDRVSLAPLDAETALRALLAVKPGDADDEADNGQDADSDPGVDPRR